MASKRDSSDGVYAISVAAELSGLGLSSLRLYERKGLIAPARTEGGTRRYSEDDMQRLEHISELVDAGLNIEGIKLVLELEAENARLRAQLAKARAAPPR
ncbi:MerR family transcriptional regulator [Sinomonas terrae]|uniref:MerR family transcriptional regulator n=1 Tax=Sinomonas terrae TaxID=2908838 RepID=A0ABS9U6T9_9MICC|nr:MerR family transcriptional regulator [Sinomonas terrae]MCH6472256.1 MerR family transcriptional regulator [Sinomonas terrae]